MQLREVSAPVRTAVLVVGATVVCSLVEVYVLRPWRQLRKLRRQGVPGFPFRPVVGAMPEAYSLEVQRFTNPAVAASTRAMHFLFEGTKIFGKVWTFSLGSRVRVVLADAALARSAIMSHSDTLLKPEDMRVVSILGDGIVTVDGEEWARQRRVISPAFHMVELRRLFATMAQCTVESLKRWQAEVEQRPGESLRMDRELASLALRIICTTAFGASLGDSAEEDRLEEIQSAMEEYLASLEFAFKWSMMVPFYSYIPFQENRTMWAADRSLRRIMRAIISERVKQNRRAASAASSSVSENTDPAGESTVASASVSEKTVPAGESTVARASDSVDLLQLMLDSTEQYGGKSGAKGQVLMSEKLLMDECLTFLFAGHETSATMLTWALLLLGQHREWQDKAREEVLALKGEDTAEFWTPDFQHLSELKLVTCILNETLRLFPPAPGVQRRCVKDTTLGTGLTIPAGCNVLISFEMLHYSEELWGQDAGEFNPLRFAEGAAVRHPGAFMPFSVGPRVCIGQNFAMMEGKLVLAALLAKFSWTVGHGYMHHPQTIFTLKPRHGLPIVFSQILN